jgi:hypothetical protein
MDALRIRTHVSSDTLHLPVLKQVIGKDVEIIVLVEPPDSLIRKKKRTPGSAKGMITMADDFAAPLPPEIVEEFYR